MSFETSSEQGFTYNTSKLKERINSLSYEGIPAKDKESSFISDLVRTFEVQKFSFDKKKIVLPSKPSRGSRVSYGATQLFLNEKNYHLHYWGMISGNYWMKRNKKFADLISNDLKIGIDEHTINFHINTNSEKDFFTEEQEINIKKTITKGINEFEKVLNDINAEIDNYNKELKEITVAYFNAKKDDLIKRKSQLDRLGPEL